MAQSYTADGGYSSDCPPWEQLPPRTALPIERGRIPLGSFGLARGFAGFITGFAGALASAFFYYLRGHFVEEDSTGLWDRNSTNPRSGFRAEFR